MFDGIKIVITRQIPENGIEMLKEKFKVEILDGKNMSKNNLVAYATDADGIVTLLSDPIDRDFISQCRKLKIISNYAVGYNNIDVAAATERKICVTNTPRTLDETTADFVFALILGIARRIVEADKFMRSGKFNGWGPLDFLGFDVYGATLGIIGMGSIGKEVARRGYYGFSMNVIYSDNSINPEDIGFKVTKTDLLTVLKESDFISVNVPLTKDTYHLIGEKELKQMKKTAYLINTSRGPVVDEKALLNVLKNKIIAGAAIDVYEREPEFEKGLEELDNIIMTPHIASATKRTRELMARKAAQNIIDFFDGKVPEGAINKEIFSVIKD
ncbi:MAG: 2-hydroxyacid dehydrogenase [Ignavibacteria bacterium]